MTKHKALNRLPTFTENYASILEAFFLEAFDDEAHCGQKQYKLKKQRYLQVQLLEPAEGYKVLSLADHNWMPDPVGVTPENNTGQFVEVTAIHCVRSKMGKWRLSNYADIGGVCDLRLYDWETRRRSASAVMVSDAYLYAQKFLRRTCALVKPLRR
jgi:hypothetical protein